MLKQDTIYALATPNGRSAVAVFRISGKNCIKIIKKITLLKKIEANKSINTSIYLDKKNKEILDNGVITFFKKPKSYTGEDILEIGVHGGFSIISDFIKLINKTNLCRIANRGEFTRRAFENNKMDLTQAEAVIDLVNAETSKQRVLAINQLRGKLGNKIFDWEKKIKNILANVEAIIDFSEEDIPDNLNIILKEQTKNIIEELKKFIDDNMHGERIRNGYRISILGKPNVGKSSLINHLAKRDISIVSNIPGTTRDIIELNYDFEGFPLIFYDTAGLRKTRKKIEKIGINKAIENSINSEINLIIIEKIKEIDEYKIKFDNIIFVQSKIDKNKRIKDNRVFKISSKNGSGIYNILLKIKKNILKKTENRENIYVSRERHRRIIEDSLENLEKSVKINDIEIVAEEIRQSLKNLSKITGRNDIEDILDIIFNDFCIGK